MLSAKLERLHKTFDEILNVDTENNIEFRYARKLQECLGYARWENFSVSMNRAIESCKSTAVEPLDQFREVTKLIVHGKVGIGGKNTGDMKDELGIKDDSPLADFLPTLTIAAKNLATEMINHNGNEADLMGEESVTKEHVQNNSIVRDMLGKRGIKLEGLPLAEDIEKFEKRVKSGEKKLAHKAGKLPEQGEVEK